MVTTSYDLGTKQEEVPRVSIIIPTKNKLNLLKNCIFSVKTNAGVPYELIVVDGGSDETWDWLKEQNIFGIKAEKDWNFSKINNEGAKLAKGEFILMLNNDVIAKKDFLVEMLKLMEDDGVGIVGAKLLHPDGTIQHIGIFFDEYGIPYHPYWGQKDSPSIALANRDDEFDAVTGACLLTRRSLWEELGGLSEEYCFNYEDVDYCLKSKERGFKTMFASRASLIHLEGASLDDRKTEEHSIQANLKIFRKHWIDSKKINSLINKKLDLSTGPYKDELLNIAFVPGSKDWGISYWRMLLPSKKLAEKRMSNVEVVTHGIPEARMMSVMANADVAIYQGMFAQSILDIAMLKDERKFKMIYELDDHPVYLSPYAQVYRTLGTQEIKITLKDGNTYWLWRDGEAGFYLETNIQNITRQIMILQNVDAITTTTDVLKDYFETKNSNVHSLPNSIDFNVFKPLDFVKNDTVRICWHGGDNHFHDVSEIGKELTDFVNKTDNVKLVFFGAFYKGPFKGIDLNKVEEESWVHVEAFPYKLRSLNVDIGLIPIADEAKFPFNKYKSDIKFCEYSSIKVPSLVSADRTAYKDCVDGENSLTFGNNKEFREKLEMLVSDAEMRKTLSNQAYDWCYEHRNLDKNAEKWLDVYKNVAGEGNGDSRSGLRTGTATSELRTTEGGDS